MTGNLVISDVNAATYVVLTKAKKHVLYRQLLSTVQYKGYKRVVALADVIINEFNKNYV